MRARTLLDLHNARVAIQGLRRVTDRLIGVGPFGVGLDGVLGWIPGVGAVYSVGAGTALLYQGIKVRAPASLLAQMAFLIGARTASDFIPAAGGLVDMLFTAHTWSADMLLKHMDSTFYVEGDPDEAKRMPEFAELMARIRSGDEKRRVVFLG